MLEWAYTCPWVFFIALIRPITGESENTEKKRSNAILTLYTGMILLLESLTIINGIYAANMAFMNNHVAYESAMELLTRISDRIESAEGYQPGVSKVCIVGSPVPYYAMKRPGFEFAESITGLVTQTSMDAAYSMQHFLTQQAGLNINLVGMYYEGNIDLKKIEKNLRDKGFSVDEKVFEKKYYEAKGFPNRDCTFWYNDLLIVKLSDGGVNEEE